MEPILTQPSPLCFFTAINQSINQSTMSFQQLDYMNGKIRMEHRKKVIEAQVVNGQVCINDKVCPSPRSAYIRWTELLYYPHHKVQLEVNGKWITLPEYITRTPTAEPVAQAEPKPSTIEMATQTDAPTMVDASTQTDAPMTEDNPNKIKIQNTGRLMPRVYICRRWRRGDTCREETCWYAHGEHLLGTMPMKQPKACHRNKCGNCPYTNEECQYHH